MSDNVVVDKSFSFAVRIVNLCKYLQSEHKEYVLSKQLIRSGTSVGANIEESQSAQSTADFIHKLSISQKEIRETNYWIKLLFKTDFLDEKMYESLKSDADEMVRLITSIIKTTKGKRNC